MQEEKLGCDTALMEASVPRLGGPSRVAQVAERGPGLYIPASVMEVAQGRGQGLGEVTVFDGAIPVEPSTGNVPDSWGPHPAFLKGNLGGHRSIHHSSVSEGVRANHEG